jgi:glycosyltransferase involved in cell wall biosynthesis
MVNNVTLVIPTYNNLQHIKNAYTSIRKWYPTLELVLLDDGSNDGTYEWLQSIQNEDENIILHRSEERVGHTILYDLGIEMATNEIVGIIHADMIVTQNYLENLLKHLDKGKVVCGTRIEPPLHPPGNEKIIQNFGLDFDDLDIPAFEEFAKKAQSENEGRTTKGMFAPWILYKEDFQRIGGHDPLFAPFPYEDSDIFQRWIMAGYELIQSRDSFVYHLTCRGHRWNDQIQKDDDYYKVASQKAARNYLRKWGSWIENDSYQYPIITPKYDIGFIIKNCNLDLLKVLEPWASTCYVDFNYTDYLYIEKDNTLIDLNERVKPFENEKNNEILVEIDGRTLNNDDFKIIQQLAKIIQDSGEIGRFTLGNLNIEIVQMNEYQNNLINVDR